MKCASLLLLVDSKKIIFCSLGGRKFDDSPKFIYEEFLKRNEFDDWKIIWAFINPELVIIPRGKKVKIDTINFFKELLTSKVWISNSGMDRGIDFRSKKILRVETEHGCPIKKIGEKDVLKKEIDRDSIRCAQSEYDRDIFVKVRNVSPYTIQICGLPRNDSILNYSEEKCDQIKKELDIDKRKKIIFYTPTYREFSLNLHNETFISPPIDFHLWSEKLADKYVLLIRAHYAVIESLHIKNNDFIKDVSNYSPLNDLYAISDMMISDYSGTFIDYSILDRPMFCFAYDYDEYKEKRGFFMDINHELPCKVHKNQNELLNDIITMNYSEMCKATHKFHMKYAPYDGHNASKKIVDIIVERLKIEKQK